VLVKSFLYFLPDKIEKVRLLLCMNWRKLGYNHLYQ
jgi:hypothetical protein